LDADGLKSFTSPTTQESTNLADVGVAERIMRLRRLEQTADGLPCSSVAQ